MEKRSFSEANISAASQELFRVSWNPKILYRINKRPTTVPVLNEINGIHASPYFLTIRFNIMLPPATRSFKWCFSTWKFCLYFLFLTVLIGLCTYLQLILKGKLDHSSAYYMVD